MFKLRKMSIVLIGLLPVFAVSQGLAQDDYPKKPIQVIHGFGSGGFMGLSTRGVNDKMAEYLGQQIILVPKPGAMGALSGSFVATSKPDGYTLLMATGGPGGFMYLPLTNPAYTHKISDFTPIGQIYSWPQTILVHKDIPAKNLRELLDYIKKHPGTMSYATIGVGSSGHLAFELLQMISNVELDIRHIPYPKGLSEMLAALLGNHSQVAIVPVNTQTIKPHRTGELRALAVLSAKRYPVFPEIATAVEQGFPDLVVSNSPTYFAPAKTPISIIKKLENALGKALQDKGVQEKLENLDLVIDYLNSQETQASINALMEHPQWDKVVKKVFQEGLK